MDPVPGDAFGRALQAARTEGRGSYVIERDDGMVDCLDTFPLFSAPDTWTDIDLEAMNRVSGRILDVGAGAGRHSLALQARGDEPVALDVSQGAVQVCRDRGVEQVYLGTVDSLAEEDPEPFDAIIMMGNNLALLESEARARTMFAALGGLLRPDGLLVGVGMDPYLTDDPIHLAYHQRNRQRGRFGGQVTMRVRYRNVSGPWFDYLFLSPAELESLASRAGWSLIEITDPGPGYLAVLERPEGPPSAV